MRQQPKKEIRIIGWDDTLHTHKTKSVKLIGVIFRGASFMDGMLSIKVEKDGTDATAKLANTIKNSRHFDQLKVIMLDGITFGGFNIIDIKELNMQTGLSVIAIQRKRPNVAEFKSAIKKVFKDWKTRLAMVQSAGELKMFAKGGKSFWYQQAGATEDYVNAILELTTIRGNIPEPLRIAHLIAG